MGHSRLLLLAYIMSGYPPKLPVKADLAQRSSRDSVVPHVTQWEGRSENGNKRFCGRARELGGLGATNVVLAQTKEAVVESVPAAARRCIVTRMDVQTKSFLDMHDATV